MIPKLSDILLGRIAVEITGADIERFLNSCAAKGVAYRGVERLDCDRLRLEVGLEGYFLMRQSAKRAMCRMRVVGKKGLPFWAQRLGRRWGLWAGAAMCAVGFWLLSGFVWTIGIDCHGESITQAQVLELLGRAGLKTGARAGGISSYDIQNSIALMDERVSYVAINLRGTHAQVSVWETKPSVPIIPQDEPCDVVSDKAGVVVALRIRQGSARVKVGDTLMAGDLIATGNMVSAREDRWQVHAIAEADLRIWHNERRRLPEKVKEASQTGEAVVRKAIIIGDRRINLYLIETEPFACYYKKVDKKELMLNEDFRFPLILLTETYIEIETTEVKLEQASAAALVEERMRQTLAIARPEAQVLAIRFELRSKGGAYEGTLQAECIETAGVERAIE